MRLEIISMNSESVGLFDILATSDRIKSLHEAIDSISSAEKPFLPSIDDGCRFIESSVIMKNSEKDISLEDFKTMCEEKFGEIDIDKAKNFKQKKGVVFFSNVAYPKEFSSCPSRREAERFISDTAEFFSIFNSTGYSFLDEFTHVYKGKLSKQNAFGTFDVICQRAISSCDPLIDIEMVQKMSIYALQRSAWEVKIGYVVINQTVREMIGESKSNVQISADRFNIKLYFSKNSKNMISLWIRVGYDVTFDKKIESSFAGVRFVYCRNFILTDAEVMSFFNASDARVPPPPPPKISKSSPDCVVYMTLPLNDLPSSSLIDSELMEYDVTTTNEGSRHRTSRSSKLSSASSLPSSKQTKSTLSRLTKSEEDESKLGASNAEILTWGISTSGLSEISSQNLSISPLALPRSLAIESIAMIAASSRHILLLTRLGHVFALGENSEGALGLGDTISRASFEMLQNWTSELPKIVKIAVGSGTLGSHSMAIDDGGYLYGWGLPHAVGLGKTDAVLTPKMIDTFPLFMDKTFDEYDNEIVPPDTADETNDIQLFGSLRCRDVACGNSFSVVVSQNGNVFSWGLWSHGRLGLGPIPVIQSKKLFRKGSSKLARYQLRPMLIPKIKNARYIACGDAHVLCSTENGKLYSWGLNTSGQIGIGPTRMGMLQDVFSPILIPPFIGESPMFRNLSDGEYSIGNDSCSVSSGIISSNNRFTVTARRVFAGTAHSFVIDDAGSVWSWGGKGGPCLGHGDPLPPPKWSSQLSSLFASSFLSGNMMIPFEFLPWVHVWSKPRMIEAFENVLIEDICGGDLHSIFLSPTGIYLCGEGPVVPPMLSEVDLAQLKDDKEDDKGDIASSKSPSNLLLEQNVVSIPTRCSSCWMPSLVNRKVALIGGAALTCIVMVTAESVTEYLTNYLFNELIKGASSSSSSSSLFNEADDQSVDSRLFSQDFSWSSPLSSPGHCWIVAAGRVLLAHKAILACRSSELRELLLLETPSDDPQQPIQLLLPELTKDIARAFLYYIYTDELPRSILARPLALRSLLRVAKAFKIPRLQLLVHHLLDVMKYVLEYGFDVSENDRNGESISPSPSTIEPESISHHLSDLPMRTLVRDLGSLVGDSLFADVRFVAEGRPIYAHRFILEARSEYFQVMFRSGMVESFDADGENRFDGKIVDVVVPGIEIMILYYILYVHSI